MCNHVKYGKVTAMIDYLYIHTDFGTINDTLLTITLIIILMKLIDWVVH